MQSRWSRTTGLCSVVPRSSLEAYGRNIVSLIGVERIGLETDLVRRPRVRGTAPLATVGKERRLPLHKMRSSGRGGPPPPLVWVVVVAVVSSVVPRVFRTKQVVVGSSLLPLFTWLILPVVICLSQRLSHASVSTCRQMAKPRTAH